MKNICNSVIVRVKSKWVCVVVIITVCFIVVDEKAKEKKIGFSFRFKNFLSHFNDAQLEGNMCTAIMNYIADSLWVGNEDHH